MHPRTKAALTRETIELHPNIEVLPPVGYLDMLSFLASCSYVITDSGGLQKEAYAFEKQSLLLMDFTPWVELVDHGYSVTTAIDRKSILNSWESLKHLSPVPASLYGDGASAKTIVSALEMFLNV